MTTAPMHICKVSIFFKTPFFSMCQLGTLLAKTVCPGAKQCATSTRAQPIYTPAHRYLQEFNFTYLDRQINGRFNIGHFSFPSLLTLSIGSRSRSRSDSFVYKIDSPVSSDQWQVSDLIPLQSFTLKYRLTLIIGSMVGSTLDSFSFSGSLRVFGRSLASSTQIVSLDITGTY